VYVEEVPGPRSIEGVSTSTTGFVGETERGPLTPKLVTSWADYTRWFGEFIDRAPFNNPNKYLPYAVRGFFENGGQRLFVARVAGSNSAIASGVLQGDGGDTHIDAVGPGVWGNRVAVLLRQASTVDPVTGEPPADRFRLQVLYYQGGAPDPLLDPADATSLTLDPVLLEDFDDLTSDSTQPSFIADVVNRTSRLIVIRSSEGTLTAPAEPVPHTQVTLAGGTSTPATRDDYLGTAGTGPTSQQGLAGLSLIEEISLLAIPDQVVLPGLGLDLLDQCERVKDRFAILSEHSPQAEVNEIQVVQDSAWGAVYYPWVRVSAPHTAEGSVFVPPCGHVAGIYARVDVEHGVHKAPANEVVRGLVTQSVQSGEDYLSHTLNQGQQDILNPRGINVIRDFRPEGRGIRVWGASTMSSDPEWRYLSVRRLFIFLEQSIDRGTQWVVFEPNEEATWEAVRTSIANFLTTVWRSGALLGATPEEAFFVKCDRTTMTQDDIDNGRLIYLIGIAPVKPAEFVIFRIGQKTQEAGT
jgi:phage tail sheath protein FI